MPHFGAAQFLVAQNLDLRPLGPTFGVGVDVGVTATTAAADADADPDDDADDADASADASADAEADADLWTRSTCGRFVDEKHLWPICGHEALVPLWTWTYVRLGSYGRRPLCAVKA